MQRLSESTYRSDSYREGHREGIAGFNEKSERALLRSDYDGQENIKTANPSSLLDEEFHFLKTRISNFEYTTCKLIALFESYADHPEQYHLSGEHDDELMQVMACIENKLHNRFKAARQRFADHKQITT